MVYLQNKLLLELNVKTNTIEISNKKNKPMVLIEIVLSLCTVFSIAKHPIPENGYKSISMEK